MIADRKCKRTADGVQRDHIGKVFLVISTEIVPLRKCLICEGVFTCEVTREHSEVRCQPSLEQPLTGPAKVAKAQMIKNT
jgi:hypothetical protein